MSDLNIADLRDAMQSVINATTVLWYGTSAALTPGKALLCAGNPKFGSPPFVVIHPDDVARLPPGARHLREYAPTCANVAEMARQWLAERPPEVYRDEDRIDWVCRRRSFI